MKSIKLVFQDLRYQVVWYIYVIGHEVTLLSEHYINKTRKSVLYPYRFLNLEIPRQRSNGCTFVCRRSREVTQLKLLKAFEIIANIQSLL